MHKDSVSKQKKKKFFLMWNFECFLSKRRQIILRESIIKRKCIIFRILEIRVIRKSYGVNDFSRTYVKEVQET